MTDAETHDIKLEGSSEPAVSTRTMEAAVAGGFLLIALLVLWDNFRTGVGWDTDGPRAGSFPFAMGLVMALASGSILVRAALAGRGDGRVFVEKAQLKLVLQVLVPTIVFVGLIGFLGLYLSAALFIAYFMIRLGHYRLPMTAAVAIGVPIALFMMFELWFKVPLPKGPIEAALGY